MKIAFGEVLVRPLGIVLIDKGREIIWRGQRISSTHRAERVDQVNSKCNGTVTVMGKIHLTPYRVIGIL